MADETWVNGEMAHKNTPKFVNKGGVSGVTAGTVNQAAFNVRNKHIAREWLYNEIKRQKYREMYNVTFDTDDGHEKERFAEARQKYYDTYGEISWALTPTRRGQTHIRDNNLAINGDNYGLRKSCQKAEKYRACAVYRI